LARAIYSDADIILLDDPLSAVDPEVSSKIFHECIRGCLKDKLVVLVTHQIQYLESCPKILLLKEGKVVVCGNYAEVNKTGFNIKEILDSFNKAL
jgi:ATP-binding cassette, subfamily C (CFTR/MRP), member 4